MAKRRMYSKDVTDSDAFLAMPAAAQALYFHLNQGADDDGFNNQVRLALIKAHAKDAALKLLVDNGFVIRFSKNLVLVVHWRMHNLLRKDRYCPTIYQKEMAQVVLKENAYCLGQPVVADMTPFPGRRLGKVRLGEVRVGEVCFRPPELEQIRDYCRERHNAVDPEKFFDYYQANGWRLGNNQMADWKAAVRSWERSGKKGKPNGFLALAEVADE